MKNALILKQTKILQTHSSGQAPSPVKHIISIATAAVQKKAAHSWNRNTHKPIFSENEKGPLYMKHHFLSEHLSHLQIRIIISFLCPILRALNNLSIFLVNLTEIRTTRCRNVH